MIRDRAHLCDMPFSSIKSNRDSLSKLDQNKLDILNVNNLQYSFERNKKNENIEKMEEFLYNLKEKEDTISIHENINSAPKEDNIKLEKININIKEKEINETGKNKIKNETILSNDSMEDSLIKLNRSSYEFSLALSQKNREELIYSFENMIEDVLVVLKKRGLDEEVIYEIIDNASSRIFEDFENKNNIHILNESQINNKKSDFPIDILFNMVPGVNPYIIDISNNRLNLNNQSKDIESYDKKKSKYNVIDNIIYLSNKKLENKKKEKASNEKIDKKGLNIESKAKNIKKKDSKEYARDIIKKAKEKLSNILDKNSDKKK